MRVQFKAIKGISADVWHKAALGSSEEQGFPLEEGGAGDHFEGSVVVRVRNDTGLNPGRDTGREEVTAARDRPHRAVC